MPHFKIDDLVPDGQYEELLSLALHRSTTIDDLWRWLSKRGHKVSRSAVHNWKMNLADPADQLRSRLIVRIGRMNAQQLRDLTQSLR